MLLEMKRNAAMNAEDEDGENAENQHEILLSSQFGFGEDPTSDSSDDDMSTFKSPVCKLLQMSLPVTSIRVSTALVFSTSHCLYKHCLQTSWSLVEAFYNSRICLLS